MKISSREFFARIKTPLSNNRGVALLIAVFSLTLMIFIAVEISHRANVEYVVAAQRVNRMRARYAAEAGVKISLLRIMLYKKAMASMGQQLQGNKSMLDPIWKLPFSWPPTIPKNINAVDRNLIKDVINESQMDAQYVTSISSEGSKIDINDLAALGEGEKAKPLEKAMRAQILKIFRSRVDNNEKFARKYGAYNFEELVNNIADWIDEDTESRNGGDERSYYPDTRSEFMPPNQPFKTLKELHMVAGMNEDFYDVLAPRTTVYGVKGINVNYADKRVIKALHPQINEDIASRIIKRRSTPSLGGFFKSTKEFLDYLEGLGVPVEDKKSFPPLYFSGVKNFRIESHGQFGNVGHKITAITYDFESLKNRYTKYLKKPKDKNGEDEGGDDNKNGDGDSGGENSSTSSGDTQPPDGAPEIVYWHEQ